MEKTIVVDSLPGFQPKGNIGKINVKEGEEVKEGDVILSLEGKKGTKDLKSEFNGVILSIKVEEGDEVSKDDIVAIIKEDEGNTDDSHKIEKEICVDSLPGFQKEGKIGKISVKEGQEIKEGDVILSLEGEKGTKDLKSEFAGKIISLKVDEGDDIKKDDIVAIIESVEKESSDEKIVDNSEYKDSYSAEVVVLGGGPGGYVAAIRASQTGKSVILIEEDKLGGTCLNRGCIPTKSMVESIMVMDTIKEAEIFGIENASGQLDMEKIMERKDGVVETLVSGIGASMDKHNITVINGRGKGKDEKSLSVDANGKDITVEFEDLILAPGSIVSIPGFEGSEEEDILTSDELLELKEVPESLIVLGGRVIAMEFAFIYNKLGADVTVIQRSDTIFPSLDKDVIDVVRDSAIENGINLIEDTNVKAIKNTENGEKIVIFEQNGEEKFVSAEKVAIATGRKPNLEGLELDKLGVEICDKSGGIKVNSKMETTAKNIYAIGDATNLYNLAHVASKQGLVAVENINGGNKEMDYSAIPEAVFTFPEIGLVGKNEKECKKEGIEYITGKFNYMANGKALVENKTEGFVKVIAEKESRKIIGASLVGLIGTDLLSALTNLVANGNTIDEAKDVVYAHPTVSETVFEAILDLDGESIHK